MQLQSIDYGPGDVPTLAVIHGAHESIDSRELARELLAPRALATLSSVLDRALEYLDADGSVTINLPDVTL